MLLTIGHCQFGQMCEFPPERDAGGVRVDGPQARFAGRGQVPLHAYGGGPFCRFRIPASYPFEGGYVITVEHGIRYIEECEHLSKRYTMGYGTISPRNCYVRVQPTNCRINTLIALAARQGQRVDLWFIATAERRQVEAELISAAQPLWNAKGIRRPRR